MKRFFTSDHHFGHANILKYEDATRRNAQGGRFQSVEKMDAYLIDQWNDIVSEGDEVYVVGDFSFKASISEQILSVLNGEKILIVGNHDSFFKQMLGTAEQKTNARERALQCGFSELYWQHVMEIPGIGIVQLSHFPYAPQKDVPEHDRRHFGHRPKPMGENLLLHGHVHSQWLYKQDLGLPPMINLGVEVWCMRPVAEEVLVNVFRDAESHPMSEELLRRVATK